MFNSIKIYGLSIDEAAEAISAAQDFIANHGDRKGKLNAIIYSIGKARHVIVYETNDCLVIRGDNRTAYSEASK